MFNITFLENLIDAFNNTDNAKISHLLEKEAGRLRSTKKTGVSKRLENLAKKIPNTNNFGAASLSAERNIEIGNPDLVTEYRPSISPEDVVLNADAKQAIASLFKEWEDNKRLISFGLNPINKILLYGAPGTGKTKLANAIANQLNMPLVLVRLDELISSYLGKTGKNLREIFDIAKERPVVLFLDEIDTIAKHRADEKELGELKRIVTVLLQNIDLFPAHSIIIGATNHEGILDKALWRRFPLKIKLELPSPKSRALLIDLFLRDIPKDIKSSFVVEITNGLSGSEIFDLCQQALKDYIISGEERMQPKNILVAYFHLMAGNRFEKKFSKTTLYQMAQHLKEAKFSLREIESITAIPYTTLRDNVA